MSWTLQPRRACSGYMYSYGKNTVRPSIWNFIALLACLRNSKDACSALPTYKLSRDFVPRLG